MAYELTANDFTISADNIVLFVYDVQTAEKMLNDEGARIGL